MEFKDYYSTLGVAKTATEKEIKQAFRKLARKHHPDVNPGDKAAEARSRRSTRPTRCSAIRTKRKKYDELGANWRHVRTGGRRRAARRPAGRGTSTSAAAARRRRLPHDDRRRDARDVRRRRPVLRFLPHLLRRRGGAPRSRAAGRAARAAPRGARRAATSSRRSSSASRTRFTARRGGSSIKHDGQARTVDVRIPAGVGDGSRVRVAGEGEHGLGRRAVGRSLSAHPAGAAPAFERKGRDLYTRVPVPLTTAVLGGEADVHDARRQVAAAEDSADDAERPGLPAEGPRHAGGRQAGRDGRPLRHGRRAAAAAADARAADSTSRRCGSWRRAKHSSRLGGRRSSKRSDERSV